MPSFTTVVEDTSPILLYSSAQWRAGTSQDSKADQYSESSFTVSNTAGASMRFPFYGKSVQVFGAKRGNHGLYTVQMDGNLSPAANGSSSTDSFNQVLFSMEVNLGLHNLTVINDEENFIDIDYVSFETSVGSDGEDLVVNSFQDSHPAFSYVPPSAWTAPSSNVGTFSGGSGHATTSLSASSVLQFEGDAVTLYGPVGPNAATVYLVTIDNGTTSSYSANKQFYKSNQILYTTSGLGRGIHSLQLKLGGNNNGELAIDYANVYTTKSLGGSFSDTAPITATTTSQNSLPGGAIAAIAILALIAAASSLYCIYLLRRQKEFKRKIERSMVNVAESKIVQPFVLPPAAPPQSQYYVEPSQMGRDYDIYGRNPNESAYAFSTPAPSTNPPSTAPALSYVSSGNYEKRGPNTAGGRLGEPSGYNTRGYDEVYGDLPASGNHPPPQYMPGNSKGQIV